MILSLLLGMTPLLDGDMNGLNERSKARTDVQVTDLEKTFNAIDSLKKVDFEEVMNLIEGNSGKSCKSNCTKGKLNLNQALQKKETFFICVSFSMGDAALKSIDYEAKSIGARLVVRGLIDNDFLKTSKKIQELEIDVAVDPNVFDENKVEVVPTFIHIKENEKEKDTLKGNVSLEYVLDVFSKGGNQESLKLLRNLRGDKK